MRKKYFSVAVAIAALGAGLWAGAKETVWFHTSQNMQLGVATELFDSLRVDADGDHAVALRDGGEQKVAGSIERLTVADNTDNTVLVDLSGSRPHITNPLAFEGVDVEVDADGGVTVRSTAAAPVTFRLSGSNGRFFKVYSDVASTIILDGVTLANPAGAALNIQCKKGASILLADGTHNSLSDAATYNTPEGEKENGTLFSTGDLAFSGKGALTVSGACKHAVASSKGITVADGTITVTDAASDGLHAEGIVISGGSYKSSGTTGDGVDAGAGTLPISGGKIDVAIAADDIKGLKADADITISGGEIVLDVASAQGKGIKTKANFAITGGSIVANMSGDAVVTDGDPSYCTTIKADGNFDMSGGSIKITSTGKAGKGISVDGDAIFSDGTVEIATSGDGDLYTDPDGVKDSYSATCITVDGNLSLLGGTFNLSSAGTAGKAIKADLDIVIGDDTRGPVITARTTGAKFLVDAGTGTGTTPPTPPAAAPGGGPGTGGPGTGGPGTGGPGTGGPGTGGPGGMDNADYANPKVVKAAGNLTVNNGRLVLSSTQDGGEGLESKNILTINGGDIHITTVDDCINASNHIQINGGVVRCVASGNDAIDSNGTITIAGGVVIAAGAGNPEGSIDCDNYTFAITGGVIFGIGGTASSPTATSCTQPSAFYSSTFSAGQRISISDASGNCLLSLANPGNGQGGQLLLTTPDFTQGATYTVSTGGTVSGGTTHHELTIGGTLSGSTSKGSVTLTSMVTGSAGGGMRP